MLKKSMETYDVKRGNYCMNTFVYMAMKIRCWNCDNEQTDMEWNEKSNIAESNTS